MSQEVMFHLDEHHVAHDLEYYTVDARDINNQIKPSSDIVHLTPQLSSYGSFLTPIAPYSLDRLYLGISMPLFSNTWGSAFLRSLLYLIKPQGDIILPVYPEAESHAKAYWCRTSLEDTFISRQRWTGFSNVNAENDGVMSMRVGRKWIEPIPSTAEWLMRFAAQYAVAAARQSGRNPDEIFQETSELAWRSGIASGVCERILQDHFGLRRPLRICEVGGGGLLAAEFLCPGTRLKVEQSDVLIEHDAESAQQLLQHATQCTAGASPKLVASTDARQYDAIFVHIADSDSATQKDLQEYWALLAQGGVLVCRISGAVPQDLPQQSAHKAYYTHAALPIEEKAEGQPPTHYSAEIAEANRRQHADPSSAFQVLYKA